jgi:F0F1-type ATP synthase assembly protein I
VLLIPITLITWPLVGYFIGRYLGHSPLVLFISIAAGLTVTFKTTARILRMILKIYRDIGKKQIAKKFSEG